MIDHYLMVGGEGIVDGLAGGEIIARTIIPGVFENDKGIAGMPGAPPECDRYAINRVNRGIDRG
jgi:hypothetical protein